MLDYQRVIHRNRVEWLFQEIAWWLSIVFCSYPEAKSQSKSHETMVFLWNSYGFPEKKTSLRPHRPQLIVLQDLRFRLGEVAPRQATEGPPRKSAKPSDVQTNRCFLIKHRGLKMIYMHFSLQKSWKIVDWSTRHVFWLWKDPPNQRHPNSGPTQDGPRRPGLWRRSSKSTPTGLAKVVRPGSRMRTAGMKKQRLWNNHLIIIVIYDKNGRGLIIIYNHLIITMIITII